MKFLEDFEQYTVTMETVTAEDEDVAVELPEDDFIALGLVNKGIDPKTADHTYRMRTWEGILSRDQIDELLEYFILDTFGPERYYEQTPVPALEGTYWLPYFALEAWYVGLKHSLMFRFKPVWEGIDATRIRQYGMRIDAHSSPE